MRKPASPSDDDWPRSLSIDAYARRHQLKPRDVRRLLGTGQLPFVQVRGQIRVAEFAVESPAATQQRG
jgi:hypothetical protein